MVARCFVIPYRRAYRVSEDLLDLIGGFVTPALENNAVELEKDLAPDSGSLDDLLAKLLDSKHVRDDSIRQHMQLLRAGDCHSEQSLKKHPILDNFKKIRQQKPSML
jgi:hypothetical protein